MSISYKKLWKLLIDRGLKKKDLVNLSDVSWSTITKMGHDEHVSTEILIRICTALRCEVDEIVEIVPKEKAQ